MSTNSVRKNFPVTCIEWWGRKGGSAWSSALRWTGGGSAVRPGGGAQGVHRGGAPRRRPGTVQSLPAGPGRQRSSRHDDAGEREAFGPPALSPWTSCDAGAPGRSWAVRRRWRFPFGAKRRLRRAGPGRRGAGWSWGSGGSDSRPPGWDGSCAGGMGRGSHWHAHLNRSGNFRFRSSSVWGASRALGAGASCSFPLTDAAGPSCGKHE